jgi:hypothetical protein
MATPVVTVAAGGLPVVDVTATFPKLGLPVAEALNGRGIAVTKVAANGLPVTFKAAGNEWPFPPNPPPTSGGGAASAEVSQWLARAPTLDAAHIAADTAFIDGLVADGDWPSFDLIQFFATQTAAIAPLSMVSAAFNGVVNGAPAFLADRGFTGVLASSAVYINLQFNPSIGTPKYSRDSAHLLTASLTDTTEAYPGLGAATAASGNVPTQAFWEKHNADGRAYNRPNVTGGTGSDQGCTVANSIGIYIGNRSTSGLTQLYKDGVQIGSASGQTSNALLNLNMYALGINANGVAVGSGKRYAAIALGSSLSAAAAARVTARFRTRMTAVGVP